MRIADQYLQCVVYIYPDEQSARDGKWTGGSGFLVHSELHGGHFVVTNKHVVVKMQAPVVRLRSAKGEPIDELRLHRQLAEALKKATDEYVALVADLQP